MALRKNLDKSNWSLILRDQNRRGRREEEEEEEKRRRKGDKKGMNSMIFGMDIT